jgi:hypothetical protein
MDAAAEAKKRGNEAFQSGDFRTAIRLYTMAIVRTAAQWSMKYTRNYCGGFNLDTNRDTNYFCMIIPLFSLNTPTHPTHTHARTRTERMQFLVRFLLLVVFVVVVVAAAAIVVLTIILASGWLQICHG